MTTESDSIFLRDLRIDTVIGIFEWERRIRQTLHFDLEMAADIRRAAIDDDINDTLDYKAVAERVIAFVQASEYNLVETLAEEIAKLVITEFSVPWLRLAVNKAGAVRGASGVGVNIHRSAEDYA